MLSRRSFLAAAGSSLIVQSLYPPSAGAADSVPSALDHVILGCNDLDRGISFVEQRSGLRAEFGGVHPGQGTRNALLRLGERRYLEIMAPDPKQNAIKRFPAIASMTEPRLLAWATHPASVDALAKHLREVGISFQGPSDGSRQRPNGTTLRWKTLTLNDDRHGLLPFFIEWNPDSIHPSVDAPKGCLLVSFRVLAPQPGELAKTFAVLNVDATVERSDKPQLRARITGPKGEIDATS